MSEQTTVAIVLDPGFGRQLASLEEHLPVWIVSSERNKSAVSTAKTSDVTTFEVCDDDEPHQNLLDVLYDVDLHHGPSSKQRPYRSILVIGVDPTPDLRKALADTGFEIVREAAGGFRANLTGPYLNRDDEDE